MTRELVLLRGQVALVDDDDYPALAPYSWRLNSRGYVIRTHQMAGKTVYVALHRVITDAQTGDVVDHIDHDRLNNTRANLRLCSQQENLMNRRRFCNNSTGFKGVTFLHNQWHARIHYCDQSIHLGFFDDLKNAALAYDCAARLLFGQYALYNLPDAPTPPEIVERVAAAFAHTLKKTP